MNLQKGCHTGSGIRPFSVPLPMFGQAYRADKTDESASVRMVKRPPSSLSGFHRVGRPAAKSPSPAPSARNEVHRLHYHTFATASGKLLPPSSGFLHSRCVANLPRSIAQRETDTVLKLLNWDEQSTQIVETRNSIGPGNIVLVELASSSLTEMFCGFGRIGASAESVDSEVADAARSYLVSGAVAGEHLTDQLLLPFAMAGCGAFTAEKLNLHSRTNMEIIQCFLPVDFMTTDFLFRGQRVGRIRRVTLAEKWPPCCVTTGTLEELGCDLPVQLADRPAPAQSFGFVERAGLPIADREKPDVVRPRQRKRERLRRTSRFR
jgi:RNA 3'-terminal phosphate cyclase